MKNIRDFYLKKKKSDFGDEIFYIFEYACFVMVNTVYWNEWQIFLFTTTCNTVILELTPFQKEGKANMIGLTQQERNVVTMSI